MTNTSRLAYLKRRRAFEAAIDALESLFRSNDFILLNTPEANREAGVVAVALDTIRAEQRTFLLANQGEG
jgi:hypothetical protein